MQSIIANKNQTIQKQIVFHYTRFEFILLKFEKNKNFDLRIFQFLFENYSSSKIDVIIQMLQEQLQDIYDMVDGITFSRPKRNINRDFSDAVMMAQLIHHYQPKIVELHNYPPASALNMKINNWNTLNTKVLRKIGLGMNQEQIKAVAQATPNAIQELLYAIMVKFEKPQEEDRIGGKGKGVLGSANQEEKGQTWAVLKARRDQTDELLRMVQQIDDATLQLQELTVMSRHKDDIIRKLEEKVQYLIMN